MGDSSRAGLFLALRQEGLSDSSGPRVGRQVTNIQCGLGASRQHEESKWQQSGQLDDLPGWGGVGGSGEEPPRNMRG